MSVLEKFATFLLIGTLATLILAYTQDPDHPNRMSSSIFWGIIIGFAGTILIAI